MTTSVSDRRVPDRGRIGTSRVAQLDGRGADGRRVQRLTEVALRIVATFTPVVLFVARWRHAARSYLCRRTTSTRASSRSPVGAVSPIVTLLPAVGVVVLVRCAQNVSPSRRDQLVHHRLVGSIVQAVALSQSLPTPSTHDPFRVEVSDARALAALADRVARRAGPLVPDGRRR
jgi:hypothetical protein